MVQGVPRLPEDWAVISYNGFVFDTRTGEPALPPGLRIESYPKGKVGNYLVTLRVPITEAVKGEITSSGAKIINFIPYNSFLVAMGEVAKARIEASSAVSWVGIFQPAHKIASWFGSQSGTKDVWVQLYQDEDINLAMGKLKGMGLGAVTIEDPEMYKILRVKMDVRSLGKVANLREVAWIEPWPNLQLYNKDVQWVAQTFLPAVRKVWMKGIDGANETVNTADMGIETNGLFFRDPAVPITTGGDFPTHRKIIAYRIITGATFGDYYCHGTHGAGSLCGDDGYLGGNGQYNGMAYKAKIYHIDIGDSTGGVVLPGNLYTGIYQPAYNGNAGGWARVSSHSWGQTGSGQYTAYCSQTDQFMWDYKDFGVYFSVGTNGPSGSSVSPPGTAKDVISTGATGNGWSATNLAGFSGRGPCNDSRRKPTVCAPGIGVLSACGGGLRQWSGASPTPPITAGNGALMRNYFRRGFYPTGDSVPGNRWAYVSAALVKAVLVNSSNNDFAMYTIPDNNIGWGRINLDNTLFFSGDGRKLAVWDDTVGLSTGQNRQFQMDVITDAEPLKITLVYTDYYAVAGANPAIVNDLDLVVTSPGGAQTYLGNVFSGGWSQTGGSADARNMEECVYIRQPERGTWTVRVDAPNVPQGTRQPYALVVTGGLGILGAQVLSLRRNVVIDSLAGSNGNKNGMVDLGETVGFIDTLYNGSAAGVTNVMATLRTNDPNVQFADSTASFGNIPTGGLANNGGDPFRLVCYGTPRVVTFILHLEGVLDNRPYSDDIQFLVRAGLKMGDVIKVISPVYSSPDSNIIYGLAFDGANLWITDWGRPRIFKVNPNTGDTVSGSIPAPTANQMTDLAWDWGDNTLWAHSVASRQVYKLDPANGTVMRQFPTPAQNYPIGLELRGGGLLLPADTLWLVGRGTAPADSKAFYKCDTLGNLIQMLSAPPFVAVPYGPRCLAWEPAGQPYWDGGTLLLAVTDFSAPGPDLLASHVYELRQVRHQHGLRACVEPPLHLREEP